MSFVRCKPDLSFHYLFKDKRHNFMNCMITAILNEHQDEKAIPSRREFDRSYFVLHICVNLHELFSSTVHFLVSIEER